MGDKKAVPEWIDKNPYGFNGFDIMAINATFGDPENVWELTAKDHPKLFTRLEEACKEAGVETPAIFAAKDEWIPAGLYLDGHKTIVISSKVLSEQVLPDQLYLIGHETGHKYSRRQFSSQLATLIGMGAVMAPSTGYLIHEGHKKNEPAPAGKPQDKTARRHKISTGEKIALGGLAASIPMGLVLRKICEHHNELDADDYAVRYFCSADEAKQAIARGQAVIDDKIEEISRKPGVKKKLFVSAFKARRNAQNTLNLPLYPTSEQRIRNIDEGQER